MVYITIGAQSFVHNQDVTTPTPYPGLPHPFDVVFNNCMRDKVPGTFVGNMTWVLSGQIYLDVGHCLEVAYKEVYSIIKVPKSQDTFDVGYAS